MSARASFAVLFAMLLGNKAEEAPVDFLNTVPDFDDHHQAWRDTLDSHGAGGVEANKLRNGFMDALGPLLRCGGKPDKVKNANIRKVILPMWKFLPKIPEVEGERIDKRTMRSVVHRFFLKKFNMFVRAFAPDSRHHVIDFLSHVVTHNSFHLGEDEYILGKSVQHKTPTKGFSFAETVTMIELVDQLVLHSETKLLQDIYKHRGIPRSEALDHTDFRKVIEQFLIEWIVEAGPLEMRALLANRTLVEEIVPHFKELMLLADGSVKAHQLRRLEKLRLWHSFQDVSSADTWNMLYTFEDGVAIVDEVIENFHSFWQDECDSMKDALEKMDSRRTGRVSLSKLYSIAGSAVHHVGESEEYLDHLGVLDKTSQSLGPQVIIPNYIQAVSNCVVTTADYQICCQTQCEYIRDAIEHRVSGNPTVDTILDILSTTIIETSLDEEFMPDLSGELTQILRTIASASGGVIPLSGRLFAQWLHFAFPRECPFPHRKPISQTPSEYGAAHRAKEEDLMKHRLAHANTTEMEQAETNWTSQFTLEEKQEHAETDEADWMSEFTPEEESEEDIDFQFDGMPHPHHESPTVSFLKLAALCCLLVYISSFFPEEQGAMTTKLADAFGWGKVSCSV